MVRCDWSSDVCSSDLTTFLIAKNRISAAEQSQAFTRGFPQKLWTKVAHQLQLKFPDHFPDDPYTLEQFHDAARFVLHSTASLSLTLDDTCTPAPTTAPVAKAEPTELTTLIDMMKQAISKLGTTESSRHLNHQRTLAGRIAQPNSRRSSTLFGRAYPVSRKGAVRSACP